MTIQSYNWVFTWNNPDYNAEPPNIWPDVAYAVWQHEMSASGTPHYQGYIQLTKRYSMATLQKNMPQGIHWEKRRGTHKEARDYAMKNDTRTDGPWEHGKQTHQGVEDKLIRLFDAVKDGKNDREIIEIDPHTWARYYNAIRRYREIYQPYRKNGEPVYTTVYFGPTGTSKSHRAAFEAGEGHYRLMVPQDQQKQLNWEGYAGEEDLVIEEFKGQISLVTMLTLCDKYSVRGNTKGSSTRLNVRRIWITSNVNPLDWWPNKGYDAFARRTVGHSGKIEHMTTVWTEHRDGELLIADLEQAAEQPPAPEPEPVYTMQYLMQQKAITDSQIKEQVEWLKTLLPDGDPRKPPPLHDQARVDAYIARNLSHLIHVEHHDDDYDYNDKE